MVIFGIGQGPGAIGNCEMRAQGAYTALVCFLPAKKLDGRHTRIGQLSHLRDLWYWGRSHGVFGILYYTLQKPGVLLEDLLSIIAI